MLVALLLAGCGGTGAESQSLDSPPSATVSVPDAEPDARTTTTTTLPTTTLTTITTTTTEPDPHAPPSWLGTVVLPLRADGYGEVQPTPAELEVRAIRTPDHLPPPDDEDFEATVSEVPVDVLERSSWTENCPVGVDELRYVTVTFIGFDGSFHTGELLVNHRVADDVVAVFRRLHEIRFPIEEMRVLSADDLVAPPTGDRNVTSAFECRAAVGSSSFSQHAYGLAVDLNPFQNPYHKGDLVLPELASSYLDRSNERPGMILPEGDVVLAFRSIGWGWGGYWNSLRDYHHFSSNGR